MLEGFYSDIVSVVVVTYNPQLFKLLETLASIICQTDINYEIIVSDDGSACNYFNEIEKYFQKYNFYNYKLVAHKKNQGTVLNFYDGIQHATGKYIKGISPGDGLMHNHVLRDWVNHVEKSGMEWSFCDAVYYRRNNDNDKEIVSFNMHPQMVDIYSEHSHKMCRWNYMVYNDIVLGAAIFCRRTKMIFYLEKIVGKIKYAEDNIFRMMMFDGIVADYYSENAIFYEVGNGVSTNGNPVWQKRLEDDWRVADELIYNDRVLDRFQRKLKYVHDFRGNRLIRRFVRYTAPVVALKLRKKWRHFQQRKSDIVRF